MSVTSRRADPTRTKALRERYAQNLRGAFGRVNADIRDRMNVYVNAERDSQDYEAFMAWLMTRLSGEVFEIVGRNDNTYIREAYSRGVEHARDRLEMGDDATELSTTLKLPVHTDALSLLFRRNYDQMEGITDAVRQDVSRALADALTTGASPSQTADRITDIVDDIGKNRATVFAHTEIINAYTEATLTQYESAGVDEVGIEAEFETADDGRVCPICKALEGDVFAIDEIREATFDHDGDTYQVTPPVHPRCRCVLLPVV